MLCSDINDENIEWANKNIKNNNLDNRITSNIIIKNIGIQQLFKFRKKFSRSNKTKYFHF